jgi:hypothetical protein
LLLLYTIYRVTQNESSLKKAQEKEREYTKRFSARHEQAVKLDTVFRRDEVFDISLDIIDSVLEFEQITFLMPEDDYLAIQGHRGTKPKRSRLEIESKGIVELHGGKI